MEWAGPGRFDLDQACILIGSSGLAHCTRVPLTLCALCEGPSSRGEQAGDEAKKGIASLCYISKDS